MTHIRPELRPGTDTGTDTVPRTRRRPSAAFSAMNQLKYRYSGPVQHQNMKRKINYKIKCTKNQKVQKKCMISTIYGKCHFGGGGEGNHGPLMWQDPAEEPVS